MSISMYIADEFLIHSTLAVWRSAGIVFSWNITKKGALCIILDNGTKDTRELLKNDRNNTTYIRQYENECTRIFPQVPELLTELAAPSVDDLVKFHKDQKPEFFIYNGEITQAPEL